MTMKLGQMSNFGSLWTSESKYIIDFERGLVTHSKTLTKGQANRWLTQNVAALRPQLNPRQAYNYYSKYLIAQKYLLFIKTVHKNQLSKLFFQSSVSYARNHIDFYEKINNQLRYPIVQMPYGGFVRTKLERDNLVKYIEKIVDKASLYGMNFWQPKNKETAQRTYDALKEIAFKPMKQATVPSSESSDQ